MKTSSSVAFSQIGRSESRQNCFVQSLHTRGERESDDVLLGEVKVLSKGIIVELEKQVHLQKVVGARVRVLVGIAVRGSCVGLTRC